MYLLFNKRQKIPDSHCHNIQLETTHLTPVQHFCTINMFYDVTLLYHADLFFLLCCRTFLLYVFFNGQE